MTLFASWGHPQSVESCVLQRPQSGPVMRARSEAPPIVALTAHVVERTVCLGKAAEATLPCLQSMRGSTSRRRRR